MSMNDLLSDFVTRIRNAKLAGKKTCTVKKNKLVVSVCEVLTKIKYFESFEVSEREVLVTINPDRINGLKRISKPGRRLYFSYKMLPTLENGIGFNILTTSKGVKTNVDVKKEQIGGELLFQIW